MKFDVFVCLLGTGNGELMRSSLGRNTRLVLWTQHSFDDPNMRGLHRAGERDAYDDFVFVSDWQKEEFLRRFQLNPARARVLRNAVAPAFENLFPADASILQEKARPPLIAYTSTPFRGLDLLLDAFPAIQAAVPGVRLRVYSSMSVYQMPRNLDEAKYGVLYRRCRETDGIEYIGSMAQPVLAKEMRNATALTYPNSFAETSCIAALEAMASGCSVITSALGALPETTAGFARLVNFGQERRQYLSQFVEQVADVLVGGLSKDPKLEAHLRRQVTYIHSNATWALRAKEWINWLG